MSYVIFHTESTMILINRKTNKEYYETYEAAKAALTRMANRSDINRDDYDIVDRTIFQEQIEKTKTVRNLMNDKEVTIPVNTPRSCDPSSELYWSM